MASYTVNKPAVVKARQQIEARQRVLESDWGESQPTADSETVCRRFDSSRGAEETAGHDRPVP